MPRDGFNNKCDCCGVTKEQLTDKSIAMGCSVYKKDVHNSLGAFLGHLTLCSWCLAALSEELQEPVKERLNNTIKLIEEFHTESEKAFEIFSYKLNKK